MTIRNKTPDEMSNDSRRRHFLWLWDYLGSVADSEALMFFTPNSKDKNNPDAND